MNAIKLCIRLYQVLYHTHARKCTNTHAHTHTHTHTYTHTHTWVDVAMSLVVHLFTELKSHHVLFTLTPGAVDKPHPVGGSLIPPVNVVRRTTELHDLPRYTVRQNIHQRTCDITLILLLMVYIQMHTLHASPAGDTPSFKACIPCKLHMCVAGGDITQHKMKEVMGEGLSRYICR